MAGQRQPSKAPRSSSLQPACADLARCWVVAGATALLLLISLLAGSVSAAANGKGDPSAAGPTTGATTGAASVSASAAAGSSAAEPEPANIPAGMLGRLELEMLALLNQDRTSPSVQDETKGRARPLEWDARLAAVAREHSEEMAATGNFSHTGADGSRPMMRVSKAGIQWLATGENIAKIDLGAGLVPVSLTTADQEVVSKAEMLFMDEPKSKPNHRGNILNPAYNHVGIGIARAADGSFYITQEFAQVR